MPVECKIEDGCKDVCGDGKKILDECDDGNLVDGDGCSSNCQIEEHFTCVDGDATKPDYCYDVRPFTVSLEPNLLDPT